MNIVENQLGGGGIVPGLLPQKMLFRIENGESSSSNEASGDDCTESPGPAVCPILCMAAAKLASESVDIVLTPDTEGLGGTANLERASTERASGADISDGSIFNTTSVINVESLIKRF